MALNYRFTGDAPNNFEVYTDGVRAMNVSGQIVLPDSFHIEEVRNITEFDVANGMNIIVLETTRTELISTAQDHGYRVIEFDDEEELTTVYNPPRITTYSPARGGTTTALTQNIVLTFTENIARAAATGPVVKLINLTANTLVETFQFDSSAITISTNTATINPTASLVDENDYALLIDIGYFTNTGATEDHGGIHDLNFYNFTAGS